MKNFYDLIHVFTFRLKYKLQMRKLRKNLDVVEKLLSKVDNVVNINDIDFE